MPFPCARRVAPLLLTGLLATGGATFITGTAHATHHTTSVTTDSPDATSRYRTLEKLANPSNDIFGAPGGGGNSSGGGPRNDINYGGWTGPATQGPVVN